MKSAPDRQQGVVFTASRLVAEAGAMFSPGAVAVADGSILLAGTKADVLRAAPAGFPRMEFPGAVIVPGLVNAHVHLQIPRFTDGAGAPLPIPASFVDWILRVIAWKRGAEPASLSGNFRSAAAEALSFGTTAVGEIAGPDLSAYDGCPLRARIFVEGIGFAPAVASGVLAFVGASIDRLEEISAGNPLVRPGVSPHTLYTVGEILLRSLADLAAAKGLPACLHLAESPQEMEFLANGGGEIATRLYPAVGKDVSWFRGLGRTIPSYLAETGLLPGSALLVHNAHIARPEIDALHAGGARFVLCPRSNAAHGNGPPDVTHFVDAKIPFALGTDSLGSVVDLSPWEEMRGARSLYKGKKKDAVLCRELFRACTERGAAALDFPGGILAPGAPADFTIVDDPGGDGDRFFRELLEKTDRANVRMTVVAGRSAHGAAA
jgi:cytosine/adenosine deaminase-related metal-dependent hydrolase